MTGSIRGTIVFVAVIVTLIASFPAATQPNSIPREAALNNQVSSVDTIARNLSNKAQDVFNIASNQRGQTPVELYVALCGFAGSTMAYSQMAADSLP